jgi:hypothetical protein
VFTALADASQTDTISNHLAPEVGARGSGRHLHAHGVLAGGAEVSIGQIPDVRRRRLHHVALGAIWTTGTILEAAVQVAGVFTHGEIR